ncbi:hypothetical protein [Bacillus sp. FJAT-26390]|uniref:DUF7662 domain-containing protein n=1 Tax=Bacillus sp. FJAT-26390 TaxID=1743142 RepID=UPI000807B182|nr:hypothetical protein [Bacillus sp. FJAT-26390]OBZ10929.1 hypothetical protein A7975_18195 [Bacillus sp. FJAT-26390]
MYNGKYSTLTDYLTRQIAAKNKSLTLAEIEDILRFKLPTSAYKYSAWWANEEDGNHSHARSWRSAGWKTADVVLGKRVTFIKE